jgi:hypothetical protein
MWYNDLLLVLMAFVVLLLIVMAIVISTWPRRTKSKVEIEPPEKMIVEKENESEIIKPDLLSGEISLLDEEQISELETIESSYPEDKEIELEEKIQTESLKQKGVIRKPPIPKVDETDPFIEFEVEGNKEETVVIEKIEPIIFDELDLDASAKISIEEQPDTLLEKETVEITSDHIIFKNEDKMEAFDTKVQLNEIEDQKKAIVEPEEESELYSLSLEKVEKPVTEVVQQKEKNEQVYNETINEVVDKVPGKYEPTLGRRVRRPVIDESDPDLKIDLGVETCPHCGSKVPNTIYCIYCGKSLEIEDPDNL